MKKPLQFKVGKYIVTPRNSVFGIFLIKLFTPPIKHWLGTLLILAGTTLLFTTTSLTSVDIFFIVFSFSVFFWNIDGRISVGMALLCLLTIVILVLLKKFTSLSNTENWSEVVAVWTYYFLVIGVLKQGLELMLEEKEPDLPPPARSHTLRLHPTKKPDVFDAPKKTIFVSPIRKNDTNLGE